MVDIADISKDVAVEIHHQGDKLEQLDSNVKTAANNTNKAGIEIDKAEQYQKKALKKLCVLFWMIVAILIVVILLIIWMAGGFSPDDPDPPVN